MAKRRNNVIAEGAIGQVKFFRSSGGYGFIRVLKPENVDNDVFFHIDDYKADNIHKDFWVEFDAVKGNKGPKAQNMRRISQPLEHELVGTKFNY